MPPPNQPELELPPSVQTNSVFTLKHWSVLFLSASITLWGLGGLILQIYQIFSQYPAIFRTFITIRSTAVYILLLQQVFFFSLTNFLAGAYGLAMFLKPSRLIKVIHFLSRGYIHCRYLSLQYQLPTYPRND
jgi:hypothetical protein